MGSAQQHHPWPLSFCLVFFFLSFLFSDWSKSWWKKMCVKVQEATWKWRSKKKGSEIVVSQTGAGQLFRPLHFLLSVPFPFIRCHYFCLQESREAHLTLRSIMWHVFHKWMTEDFFFFCHREGSQKGLCINSSVAKLFHGDFWEDERSLWTCAGSRGLWSMIPANRKPGAIPMGTVLSSKQQTKTPLYGA